MTNSNFWEKSGYKKVEIKRSSRLAEKVRSLYERGSGLKHLFGRLDNKIMKCICRDDIDLKSKKLLDIGCGFGDFLSYAEKKLGHTYGIDLIESEVEAAKRFLPPNSEVIVAEGENLPFENNFFDFVVIKGVVHHFAEPIKVFQEIKRILKKGGRLIILEGNPSSSYRKWILKIADILKIEHESSLFSHLSFPEIAALLKEVGFRSTNQRISGFFTPFGLVGFGNANLWQRINTIEDFLERRMPFFMWHNLIIAELAD